MSNTAVTVLDLRIRVSREEVIRNLGYPPSGKPAAQVEQQLDALWNEAHELLAPRGCWRIVDQQLAASTQMPDPSPLVGLGLCTIGPHLEQREQRLSQKGQVLEALLLDAFGSTAAVAAADALVVTLCAHARSEGYGLQPRINPGYGSWNILGQRDLLSLLQPDRVGVRLTQGLMMVPRKSVSFAVRLDREIASGETQHRYCSACEMQDCAYRRS